MLSSRGRRRPGHLRVKRCNLTGFNEMNFVSGNLFVPLVSPATAIILASDAAGKHGESACNQGRGNLNTHLQPNPQPFKAGKNRLRPSPANEKGTHTRTKDRSEGQRHYPAGRRRVSDAIQSDSNASNTPYIPSVAEYRTTADRGGSASSWWHSGKGAGRAYWTRSAWASEALAPSSANSRL